MRRSGGLATSSRSSFQRTRLRNDRFGEVGQGKPPPSQRMPVGIISLIAFRLPTVVFEGQGIRAFAGTSTREKGPFRVKWLRAAEMLRAGSHPEGPRPGWYRGGAGRHRHATQCRSTKTVSTDGELVREGQLAGEDSGPVPLSAGPSTRPLPSGHGARAPGA
jgi:hypothetical protein